MPQKQREAWGNLQAMAPKSVDVSQNWDITLKVAESSALPSKRFPAYYPSASVSHLICFIFSKSCSRDTDGKSRGL